MGGLPTDINGGLLRDEKGSVIDGLFAAGECACVSVHGANRLGCNSLLDTVVFGRRAGIAIGKFLMEADRPKIGHEAAEKAVQTAEDLLQVKGEEKAAVLRDELRAIMTDRCSVFRNKEGLKSLVDELAVLKERAKKVGIKDRGRRFNTELLETIELFHMLSLSEVIARSALQRAESRGAHSREDFPKRDDPNWLKHTFAFKSEKGMEFRHRAVAITRFQPEERKY
jgi:succinate dehydrogenase / fumarate reductase flavoprotein subunit